MYVFTGFIEANIDTIYKSVIHNSNFGWVIVEIEGQSSKQKL